MVCPDLRSAVTALDFSVPNCYLDSMKRFAVLAGIVILCMSAVSCRTKDVRTVTIRVPEMKNQSCVQIVTEAIARQQGVLRETINPDPVNKVVILRYDSMQVAIKNIEHAVAEAGFRANEIPADEQARQALPADCR